MAEYIEREALIKRICNSCDGWCENTECDCVNCKSKHRCDLVQEIHDCPTADVVEVVRCKDCARREHDSVCEYYGENAFCSRGRRRADK